MGVTVRRAQSSDLDQLMELWKELAELHAGLVPEYELVPDNLPDVRTHLAEMIGDENRRVFVAEEDGTLIGFINGAVRENPPVFAVQRIGFIDDAIVTANSRRHGIGEQLVRVFNEWLHERGVRIVHLNAATGNPMALAFWRKMGFAEYAMRFRGELK